MDLDCGKCYGLKALIFLVLGGVVLVGAGLWEPGFLVERTGVATLYVLLGFLAAVFYFVGVE